MTRQAKIQLLFANFFQPIGEQFDEIIKDAEDIHNEIKKEHQRNLDNGYGRIKKEMQST